MLSTSGHRKNTPKITAKNGSRSALGPRLFISPPLWEGNDVSTNFGGVNRGKLGMTLDLKADGSRDVLRRLETYPKTPLAPRGLETLVLCPDVVRDAHDMVIGELFEAMQEGFVHLGEQASKAFAGEHHPVPQRRGVAEGAEEGIQRPRITIGVHIVSNDDRRVDQVDPRDGPAVSTGVPSVAAVDEQVPSGGLQVGIMVVEPLLNAGGARFGRTGVQDDRSHHTPASSRRPCPSPSLLVIATIVVGGSSAPHWSATPATTNNGLADRPDVFRTHRFGAPLTHPTWILGRATRIRTSDLRSPRPDPGV